MHILFITQHFTVHSFETVCSFVTVGPDALKVVKIRIPVFWDVCLDERSRSNKPHWRSCDRASW